MTKAFPTIKEIEALDKWGQDYCRIYQRLYQRKRRNIISKDEIELFEMMKKCRSNVRSTYHRREYDKGKKVFTLNVRHEKIFVKFD